MVYELITFFLPQKPNHNKGTKMTDGQQVAIKVESRRAAQPQLEYESKVYKALSGGIGIPQIRYFGKEGEHNMLVMDLLGPSLEDLFNICKRRFSLKTILLLMDQLVIE
jgi:casein kinase I family protein HRR25